MLTSTDEPSSTAWLTWPLMTGRLSLVMKSEPLAPRSSVIDTICASAAGGVMSITTSWPTVSTTSPPALSTRTS